MSLIAEAIPKDSDPLLPASTSSSTRSVCKRSVTMFKGVEIALDATPARKPSANSSSIPGLCEDKAFTFGDGRRDIRRRVDNERRNE